MSTGPAGVATMVELGNTARAAKRGGDAPPASAPPQKAAKRAAGAPPANGPPQKAAKGAPRVTLHNLNATAGSGARDMPYETFSRRAGAAVPFGDTAKAPAPPTALTLDKLHLDESLVDKVLEIVNPEALTAAEWGTLSRLVYCDVGTILVIDDQTGNSFVRSKGAYVATGITHLPGSTRLVYKLGYDVRTSSTTTTLFEYVLKVQEFDNAEEYGNVALTAGIFRRFVDCNIVRARMWPLGFRLLGLAYCVVTLMETLAEDCHTFGLENTASADAHAVFVNFVGTVLGCLRERNATFSDFKLENVGHSLVGGTHVFRLIDLDSVNRQIFTDGHAFIALGKGSDQRTSIDALLLAGAAFDDQTPSPEGTQLEDAFLWYSTTCAALTSVALFVTTDPGERGRLWLNETTGAYEPKGIDAEGPVQKIAKLRGILAGPYADLWNLYGEPLAEYVTDFFDKHPELERLNLAAPLL